MRTYLRFIPKATIFIAVGIFVGCDNLGDQAISNDGTRVESEDMFAGAAARGNSLAVTALSPTGEILDEFRGSPDETLSFLRDMSKEVRGSASKSQGGGVPWINYVIREPATIGFSGSGTSFTLLFPDWGPAVSPYPMYYSVRSIFFDDDLPVAAPILNYNNTPGDSQSSTSTTSYPGPSGQSGHHLLWGVYYNNTGYDPCDNEWESNSDYGIKASTTTGGETSANYQLTIDVGDCLPDIIHYSGYPQGSTTFTYQSSGDYWQANNQGYTYFQITAKFDTNDHRSEDMEVTSASCDEPENSGFPSGINTDVVIYQVNMTGVSGGAYATCTATVEDTVTSINETFTYRIYQ